MNTYYNLYYHQRMGIYYYLKKVIPISHIRENIFFEHKNKIGLKLAGFHKLWYDDGSIWWEVYHVDGVKEGIEKIYRLKMSCIKKCSECLYIIRNYVGGILHGEYKQSEI